MAEGGGAGGCDAERTEGKRRDEEGGRLQLEERSKAPPAWVIHVFFSGAFYGTCYEHVRLKLGRKWWEGLRCGQFKGVKGEGKVHHAVKQTILKDV